MGAMLEMMQRMMGKAPGDKPGDKPGKKPGDKAGNGMTGDSDSANTPGSGGSAHPTGERVVPKNAGTAGAELPEEFRKALDAYNRPPAE